VNYDLLGKTGLTTPELPHYNVWIMAAEANYHLRLRIPTT